MCEIITTHNLHYLFVLFADEEVDAIVNAIKSKSKAVIELGKKFFYTHLEKDIYSAYK